MIIDIFEQDKKKAPKPREKKALTRPKAPINAPRCYGEWIADTHCLKKCDIRKSCRREYKYKNSQ